VVEKIRFYPGESSRSDTKPGTNPLKNYRVINGIKSSGQIKESETGDLLMTYGLDDVIMNRK
jgi:hypothetical protein